MKECRTSKAADGICHLLALGHHINNDPHLVGDRIPLRLEGTHDPILPIDPEVQVVIPGLMGDIEILRHLLLHLMEDGFYLGDHYRISRPCDGDGPVADPPGSLHLDGISITRSKSTPFDPHSPLTNLSETGPTEVQYSPGSGKR